MKFEVLPTNYVVLSTEFKNLKEMGKSVLNLKMFFWVTHFFVVVFKPDAVK